MEKSIEVKKQEIIIAADDNDFNRQIEEIKKTLQANQQIVVAKNIVASVLVVETTS